MERRVEDLEQRVRELEDLVRRMNAALVGAGAAMSIGYPPDTSPR